MRTCWQVQQDAQLKDHRLKRKVVRESEFKRATCSVFVLPGDKLPATTLGLQAVDDATCRSYDTSIIELRSDPQEASADSGQLIQSSDTLTTGNTARPLFTCDDGLISKEEKQNAVIRHKLEAIMAWDRQIISDFQLDAKMPWNKGASCNLVDVVKALREDA